MKKVNLICRQKVVDIFIETFRRLFSFSFFFALFSVIFLSVFLAFFIDVIGVVDDVVVAVQVLPVFRTKKQRGFVFTTCVLRCVLELKSVLKIRSVLKTISVCN